MKNQINKRFALFVIAAPAILALAACDGAPADTTSDTSSGSSTDLQPVASTGAMPMEGAMPDAANTAPVAIPTAPSASATPESSGSKRLPMPKAAPKAPSNPAAIESTKETKEAPQADEHSGHDMEGMSDHDMQGM